MRPASTLAALVVGSVLVGLATGCGAAMENEQSVEPGFRRTVFAHSFSSPVLLTHAPGDPGTSYVVEQTGRVIRLRAGNPNGSVFLDIRRRVDFGGERGLLGLAFHPSYRLNRLFYVAYTSKGGQNVVARYRARAKVNVAIASSHKTLLAVQDPYGNHNGGHLVFGPDRMLYTTIGDGGAGGDPEGRSQDMRSLFGKLLRLDVSGAGADWEIAALGLRNAWRFSFDRETGDLYLGDVGQGAVEEVDFTPRRSPGLENYGWDLFEGSRRFEEGTPGPGRLVFPVFEYGHNEGCTIIGGYVYRGRARPAERGRYLFGDYCSGTVWSLRMRSDSAGSVRRESFRIPGLTSFGEGSSGEIFALAENGLVYRLS